MALSPSFTLSGQVVPGKRLGSSLGFPTANILYDPYGGAWPPEGVYIAIAGVEGEGRKYVSILNQGRHPTVPEGSPTVEAHLLGHPDHELYGKRLHLEYYDFLRPERSFPSLEALKAQLGRDRISAIHWAGRNAPELLEGLEPPPSPYQG